MLKTFARTARKRMRTDSGGYRRDHLRALAQRVEVNQKELRIMGSKARFCARSSPLKAQKRRVLACPALYQSGALGEIRTPDPRNRNPMLYPAELRARWSFAMPAWLAGQGGRRDNEVFAFDGELFNTGPAMQH